ncbi:hypothetical protein D9758_007724 [Tetrapyrgos nigripes]|uniref:GH16 domain-containing protein n=1 Tax=Tetrapyrgos nigripes TaxID=182062 RepID=A0A8H5G559_9AGAR|nr:hypothetical protein D9758_007724 [Tetrapyrgos nigripes]
MKMFLTTAVAASLSILSIVPISLAVPAPIRRFKLGVRQTQVSAQGTTWTLSDKYEGQNFFDGWDFFKDDDPTHGFVQYQPEDVAKSQSLAVVGEDGVVTLSVDDKSTPPQGTTVSDDNPYKRSAVRITTKKRYNGGLFIANFSMMPDGCSTWPAYWYVHRAQIGRLLASTLNHRLCPLTHPTVHPTGELDILEGVNGQGSNKLSAHTGPTCSLQVNPSDILGTPPATMPQSCDHQPGCGVSDTTPSSFGSAFNKAGGGILVHRWTSQKIEVWHFKHEDAPQDIANGAPNPDGWGKPQFMLGGDQCEIPKNFVDNSLIINTSLCGDWAGGAWADSTCNKKPDGTPLTCAEAVADPKMFTDAKWKINFIHVYQSGDSQVQANGGNPSLATTTSSTASSTVAQDLASDPTPGSSPSLQSNGDDGAPSSSG